MPTMTPEFKTAMAKFMEELTVMFRNHRPNLTLQTEEGSVYIKIVTHDGQGSVYAFVQKNTGDIYKPASYKAPIKNFTRGNIFNDATRMSWCGPFGMTTAQPGRKLGQRHDPEPETIIVSDPTETIETVAKRFAEKGLI